MQRDWSKIKFLESASNLKLIARRVTERTLSTSVAREAGACLQQGRMFFEIAETAPLQVQPLQIFYGIVSFAKAVIIIQSGQSLSTLAQAHGLSDVSDYTSKLENLTFRFRNRGTFQEFNDVVAKLGRFAYFEHSMRRFLARPFDKADSLAETTCTLEEVLARVPGLQEHFERTFARPASCTTVDAYYHGDGLCDLRIDDAYLFVDRDDLAVRVEFWREQYPWLRSWAFKRAQHAWDNSVIIFQNVAFSPSEEFSLDNVLVEGPTAQVRQDGAAVMPLENVVPVLAGGITKGIHTAIRPLNGANLSEFSLQFCGSFLLSSLVRYRPSIWQRALSRTAFNGEAPDDSALSLIETFSHTCLTQFPTLIEAFVE